MCVQVPRRRRSIEEDISKTKKRLQEVRKPALVFLIQSTLQSLKLQINCSWDMLCTQRRRMLLNRWLNPLLKNQCSQVSWIYIAPSLTPAVQYRQQDHSHKIVLTIFSFWYAIHVRLTWEVSFPFFLLLATYSCQVWGQCGRELWIPRDSTVWLNLPFSFSEPLLSKANRLIQDLDQTFSELTALHDEVYTIVPIVLVE